jgi:transposase
VETLLKSSRVAKYYQCSVSAHPEEGWELHWEVDSAALTERERLDGLYSIVTNIPASEATAEEVFSDYKRQTDAERRFADWKGPLGVRPVFLKSNRRIVGLVLVLAIALLVFCLIERELRRRLPDGAMTGLLPVRRPVKATGRNILKRLSSLTVVGVRAEQDYLWQAPDPDPVQARILELLDTDLATMVSRLRRPP